MKPTKLPLILAVVILAALESAASAQWLDYPTPGVPKTADGKPSREWPICWKSS